MTPDELKLTTQELDDIKDDIKFRTSTTIFLKTLHTKVDIIENNNTVLKTDVSNLKSHKAIQWWFIGGIFITIIMGAIKISMAG